MPSKLTPTRIAELRDLLRKFGPAAYQVIGENAADLLAMAEALLKIQAPPQALVDAVANVLANQFPHVTGASLENVVIAAIAAIWANETCAQCGAALALPTLCSECVADKTPVVVTDRRAPR